MKPKRRQNPRRSNRASAQVISLAAYRAARGLAAAPAQPRPAVPDLYGAWLALAGAAWAWWW